MQKVFYVLTRYKKIAILCSIASIVLAGTLLFFHEVHRSDILLIEHVQDLVIQQKQLIHIPHGWEIEANSNCLQQTNYSISFHFDQELYRKIIYPYVHHDTKFCISKQTAIAWSIYHSFTIAIITLVCIGFWILLYYVLSMFLFARTWKLIVHIQHMCTSESIEKTNTETLAQLIYILGMYQSQPAVYKTLHSEFSATFKQLHSDLQFHIEQKKIPDICYREFKNLFTALDSIAQ